MEKEICLIAAMANNGVIGYKGNMPWPRIPEDMGRFRGLTKGHPVIMGRKTYDSLLATLGHTLPNRQNIVISRGAHPSSISEQTSFFSSVQEAIQKALAQTADKVYIIGGGEIYRQTINVANRLKITEIHADYEGDTYFPQVRVDEWKETARATFHNRAPFSFSFVSYVRR